MTESGTTRARQRVVLTVAYDGAPYSGFVKQDNGPSVAAELERAIAVIDAAASPVTASSRTDAGVHARGQVVSFTTEKSLTSRSWVLALSGYLPASVSVVHAAFAPLEFDPRVDPVEKRYRYRVLRSHTGDPLLVDRAMRVHNPLDLSLMQAEAKLLEGEHDFAAFRSAVDLRTNTIRNLRQVSVSEAVEDPRILDIVVVGDRFMHNMVRIIAGTLIDVGRGRLPPRQVTRAFEEKDRALLGVTAPAAGLYLEQITLRTPLSDVWPPVSGADR